MLREYLEGIREELEAITEAEQNDEIAEQRQEDGETTDFYEWAEDVLDIEYIIGGDMSYRGVEVAVTLGGPNVYVNTRDGVIKGSWGSDRETIYLTSDVTNAIDNIFEDTFYAMR